MEVHPVILRELKRSMAQKSIRSTRMWTVAGAAFLLLFGWMDGGRIQHDLFWLLGLVWGGTVVAPALSLGAEVFRNESREEEQEILLTTPLRWSELLMFKMLGIGVADGSFQILVGTGVSIAVLVVTRALYPAQGILLFAQMFLTYWWVMTFVAVVSIRARFSPHARYVATGLLILLFGSPLLWRHGWLGTLLPSYLPWDPYLHWNPFMPMYEFTRGLLESPDLDFRSFVFTLLTGVLMWLYILMNFRRAAASSLSQASGGGRSGFSSWMRSRRRTWLEKSPFAWLALRNQVVPVAGWSLWALVQVVMLGVGFTGAWGGWRWSCFIALVWGVCLLFLFRVLLEFDVCQQIARERTLGTLGLLLIAPRGSEELVQGQLEATRRRFFPLLVAAVALDLQWIHGSMQGRDFSGAALVVYLQLWLFLFYWQIRALQPRTMPRPFKVSLLTGNPWAGLGRSFRGNGWVFINLFANGGLLAVFKWGDEFPTGSMAELVLVTFAVVAIAAITAAYSSQVTNHHEKLLSDMLQVATVPIPRGDDPALAQWKDLSQWPGIPGLPGIPEHGAEELTASPKPKTRP